MKDKNKKGKCTEYSKILFAAMKMAGPRPIFTWEYLRRENTSDPVIKDVLEGAPIAKLHMCVGVYIGKRLRLFDPMFMNSNSNYRRYTPLSLRQYLSIDYANRGMAWSDKNELDKDIADQTRAINMDSKNAEAYYSRGIAWQKNGKSDKAEADYTMAISIDANHAEAYGNRGVILLGKGELDKAMTDFTKASELEPEYAEAYYNCGVIWISKSAFDKAIANMAKATALDAGFFRALSKATMVKWQSSEELKNTAGLFRAEMGGADISAYEAQFALAYALWELKGHEEAKKALEDTLKYLSFKKTPSKPIADFFKDMFALMPAQMKKDKGVRKILKSLREKMK